MKNFTHPAQSPKLLRLLKYFRGAPKHNTYLQVDFFNALNHRYANAGRTATSQKLNGTRMSYVNDCENYIMKKKNKIIFPNSYITRVRV